MVVIQKWGRVFIWSMFRRKTIPFDVCNHNSVIFLRCKTYPLIKAFHSIPSEMKQLFFNLHDLITIPVIYIFNKANECLIFSSVIMSLRKKHVTVCTSTNLKRMAPYSKKLKPIWKSIGLTNYSRNNRR